MFALSPRMPCFSKTCEEWGILFALDIGLSAELYEALVFFRLDFGLDPPARFLRGGI